MMSPDSICFQPNELSSKMELVAVAALALVLIGVAPLALVLVGVAPLALVLVPGPVPSWSRSTG